MQHSPDRVHPRDVEEFHPRDRKIALLIQETLANYDATKLGEIALDSLKVVDITTSIEL